MYVQFTSCVCRVVLHFSRSSLSKSDNSFVSLQDSLGTIISFSLSSGPVSYRMSHAPGLSGSQMLEGCSSWDSASSLSRSVRCTVSTARNTVPVADTAAEFPLGRPFNKGTCVFLAGFSFKASGGSKCVSYVRY